MPTLQTYADLLRHVPSFRKGRSATEVRGLLGKPQLERDGIWIYRFSECYTDIPSQPRPGEQLFLGLTVIVKDGRAAEFHWASLDATGPG